MATKEKALDWTESQKEKANKIGSDFMAGKIRSIPK